MKGCHIANRTYYVMILKKHQKLFFTADKCLTVFGRSLWIGHRRLQCSYLVKYVAPFYSVAIQNTVKRNRQMAALLFTRHE